MEYSLGSDVLYTELVDSTAIYAVPDDDDNDILGSQLSFMFMIKNVQEYPSLKANRELLSYMLGCPAAVVAINCPAEADLREYIVPQCTYIIVPRK